MTLWYWLLEQTGSLERAVGFVVYASLVLACVLSVAGVSLVAGYRRIRRWVRHHRVRKELASIHRAAYREARGR